MSAKEKKTKIDKAEEPAVNYDFSKPKQQGVDRTTFDFDAEFEKGYTAEEFKAEMHKRIKAYPWKK